MSALETKKRIMEKQTVLGTFLIELDTPGIAQILKNAGLEFAVLDMEHSGFGIDTIKRLARYCDGADLFSIVRVPVGQYQYVARVLDAGAKGVMIPMVESPEQIAEIVQFAKYHPEGKRGTAFGIAHDNYKVTDMSEAMKKANAGTLIVSQAETAKGVENLEAIIQVEHVDMVWIGQFDLSQSLGVPGKFEHPIFVDAMDHVINMCNKYNKPCAMIVPNVEQAVYWRDKGINCLSYGTDISIISQTIQQAVTQIMK